MPGYPEVRIYALSQASRRHVGLAVLLDYANIELTPILSLLDGPLTSLVEAIFECRVGGFRF